MPRKDQIFDEIFTDKVRKNWVRFIDVGFQHRLAEIFLVERHHYWTARHNAVRLYIQSAQQLGLFNGIDGIDRIKRLQDPDLEQHRGALAECIAAHFLESLNRILFTDTKIAQPRKNLDFAFSFRSEAVNVEVKSRFEERDFDSPYRNQSKSIEKMVRSAKKQFSNAATNLLVIVPSLAYFVTREEMEKSLIGSHGIQFFVKSESGLMKSMQNHFFPNGLLVRKGKPDGTPANTRISAIASIQRFMSLESIETLHAIVVHNPFAIKPMSEEIFRGSPQLVKRGDYMKWIDPGLGD